MSQVKNLKASLKYTSWKQDSDVTKPDFTSGSADSTVTFSGDLDGKGVGTYVITRHPDKNNDTEYYDGHLLFEGTINGKEGAVILRENGVVKNGKIQANWVISSDTASGDLRGIVGAGSYQRDPNSDEPVTAKLEVEF